MAGYSRYSFSQTFHPPVTFDKKYTNKVLEGNWFNDRQDREVDWSERLDQTVVRPKEEALQTQDGEVLRPLGKVILDDTKRVFAKDVADEDVPAYFETMYQERFRYNGAFQSNQTLKAQITMDNLEQVYVDRQVNVLPKHPPSEFARFFDTTYKQTIDIGLDKTTPGLPAAGFGKWGSAPRKAAPDTTVPVETGVSWAKSGQRFVGGKQTQEVTRPLFKGGSLNKMPFWDSAGNSAGADRSAAAEGPHFVQTALTKVHNGVWADEPTKDEGYNWMESTTRQRPVNHAGHAPTTYHMGYNPI